MVVGAQSTLKMARYIPAQELMLVVDRCGVLVVHNLKMSRVKGAIAFVHSLTIYRADAGKGRLYAPSRIRRKNSRLAVSLHLSIFPWPHEVIGCIFCMIEILVILREPRRAVTARRERVFSVIGRGQSTSSRAHVEYCVIDVIVEHRLRRERKLGLRSDCCPRSKDVSYRTLIGLGVFVCQRREGRGFRGSAVEI